MIFHSRTICTLVLLYLAQFVAISANAQPPSEPLVHPLGLLNAPREGSMIQGSPYQRQEPAYKGLAAKGDKWTFYSGGINEINDVSIVGSETWLATNFGVKMLDNAKGTMTHYTKFNGLPGMKTHSISADDKDVFCIQSDYGADGRLVEFCKLNRKTGVWETLRQTNFSNGYHNLPKPRSSSPSPDDPIRNTIAISNPERAVFAFSPVEKDSKALAYVYDRRLNRMNEIPNDPIFHQNNPFLSLNWAQVDRDNVWFGTNAGLLGWNFREKKWRTYLQNRTVCAGVRAEDGKLWLAAYEAPKPTPDEAKVPADSAKDCGSGSLVRFDTKTFTAKAYSFAFPDPNLVSNANYRTPIVTGMSFDRGAIWLTCASANQYYASICFASFNPRKEKFDYSRPYNREQLDAIPDVALLHPTLTRDRLLATYVPGRFQKWICREDEETNNQFDIVYSSPPPAYKTIESQALANGIDLSLIEHFASEKKLFSPVGLIFPNQMQVSSLVRWGDRLLALSGTNCYSYDLKKESWNPAPFPDLLGSYTQTMKVIPGRDSLLFDNSIKTVRYFPKNDLFKLESRSENAFNSVIGEDSSGVVWSVGENFSLRRPDPETKFPVAFHPPALAEILMSDYEEMRTLGFSNGIIWLYKRHRTLEKSVLAGYDPVTKQWTPTLNLNFKNCYEMNSLVVGSKSYLVLQNEKGTILCYDSAKKQWINDIPTSTGATAPRVFALASVDDREAWGYSQIEFSMLRYDRGIKKWEAFPIRAELSLGFGNSPVRHGNTIYLGTLFGVWGFDIVTHSWKQLPGLPVQKLAMEIVATNSRNVWLVARNVYVGNHSFIVRFDKKTSTWTRWTEEMGIQRSNNLEPAVTDEDSCWLTSENNNLYHFLPETNRWENVSALLGGNARPVIFHHVVPDGKQVWLEVNPYQNRNKDGNPFASAVVVRYNKETGKYAPLTPDANYEYYSSPIAIFEDFIYMASRDGVFSLDKKTLIWKEILIPQELKDLKRFEISTIKRRDNELWLAGVESAIRLKLSK